jgi:hypothetical protein
VVAVVDVPALVTVVVAAIVTLRVHERCTTPQ